MPASSQTDALRVRCDGVTYTLVAGAELRFGRHPDTNEIVIGSARRGGVEDMLVSRRTGTLTHRGSRLSIVNTGRYEPIEVVSGVTVAHSRRLAPGDELTMPVEPISVGVRGRVRRYQLVVEVDGALPVEPLAVADGDSAAACTEGPLSLSDSRRLDLAALCAPLLTAPPGRMVVPASYAEAALRRGVTRKAMERRIEHLVEGLRRSGTLPHTDPGVSVKDALCQFAVRSATVTKADVDRLCSEATNDA